MHCRTSVASFASLIERSYTHFLYHWSSRASFRHTCLHELISALNIDCDKSTTSSRMAELLQLHFESWLINAERLYRQTCIEVLCSRLEINRVDTSWSAIRAWTSKHIRINIHLFTEKNANSSLLSAVTSSANLQFAVPFVHVCLNTDSGVVVQF